MDDTVFAFDGRRTQNIILGFLWYLKCQQNHSNKPISGAGSPSCRPGSVQLNVYENMKRHTDPYGKAMKK